MIKRAAPKKTKASTPSKRRVGVVQQKRTSDPLTGGDAAERGPADKVPRQATHVVTRDASGTLVVKHLRFKAF